MPPKFGTSGLRGLVAELTDGLVADHVRAFLHSCDVGSELYLGRDLRASSAHIASVAVRTARDAGIDVVDCGALPTPALALAALEARAGALMVTGSHIPDDRNGLKFYAVAGEITKDDEAAILNALGQKSRALTAKLRKDDDATSRFRDRYLNAFGADTLCGMRVGVYAHSSVGRDMLAGLLDDLGATVVELGRAEHFVAVDTEAVDAVTCARLRDWATHGEFDAIVSTDGDADRPLLTDAAGEIIPGDVLGQITAQFLGAEVVVTPVSSNSGVVLSARFATIERTRIGSPFVIAGIHAHAGARVVGYEANGGFLLGFDAACPHGVLPRLLTRDCILPIVATLLASKAEGSVAARVAQEPARFTAADRLENVPTNISAAFIAALTADTEASAELLSALGLPRAQETNTIDGLRIITEKGLVLHLRPSGNAPELRVYVEADRAETAKMLLERTKQYLQARLMAEGPAAMGTRR